MLKPGEIAVWRADLDAIPPDALPPLLPDEAGRAARFRSEQVRARFVASHGVLRAILAGAGVQPVYRRDDRGKPQLIGNPGVHFNLARSHGRALYAITVDVPAGADIERIRDIPEYMAIAERFLPPSRFAALLECPPAARMEEFFRLWTRLEASLKALGIGLYGAGSEPAGPWTVADVEAGEGFIAAVAAPAADLQVVVRDFQV